MYSCRKSRLSFLFVAVLGFTGYSSQAQTNLTCNNLVVVGAQAQGTNSIASGIQSTADGTNTTASGNASHAEGDTTIAIGKASHAEGVMTEADGQGSHSEGYYTTAGAEYSHAGGKYAKVRTNDLNAFIHATGTGTNSMKQTAYSDTAHFDRMILFESSNNDSNSVLARWENDTRYATVSQGAKADTALQPNTVVTTLTVVAGQFFNNSNVSSGLNAIAIGGANNFVNGQFSTIGGGISNVVQSYYSTIVGGYGNAIGSTYGGGFVGGGIFNNGWGGDAFVGGGYFNSASGSAATVVGGMLNSVGTSGEEGFVGGGVGNYVAGFYSVVCGGYSNRSATFASAGTASTVGGGLQNTVSGSYATIPGGRQNSSVAYAFAAGRRAQATNTGSFVWADQTDADFGTTATNQFLIRASGGVGIGTNSPAATFDVAGNGKFSGGVRFPAQGDLSMGVYTNGAL